MTPRSVKGIPAIFSRIFGRIVYFFYTQVKSTYKLMKLCRHALLEVALIFGDFEMLYYPKSDTTNHKLAGRTTLDNMVTYAIGDCFQET